MMAAKRLGDLIPVILKRTEAMIGFQERLNDMASDAARKAAIMDARADGFISNEDCTLLIQAYGVEHS